MYIIILKTTIPTACEEISKIIHTEQASQVSTNLISKMQNTHKTEAHKNSTQSERPDAST